MSRASKEYHEKRAAIEAVLDSIQWKLRTLDEDQRERPRDWGYVGSVGHALSELREVERFLS